MEKLVDTHELERELRATLSAQREIGPNYEHQLVENFMQKVNRQGLTPPPPAQGMQTLPNVALGLRLALAILSLIFLIPLSAIAVPNGGLPALVVIGLVVLGINFAFNRHR